MESATGISTELWYIITLAVATVAGIIGYFLKQTMSRVDTHEKDINVIKQTYATKNEVDGHDKDINTIKQSYVTKNEMSALRGELKDDIKRLTEDVGDIKENFLAKGDFYRVQANTDKKLDKMYDLLLRMSGGNGNGNG